jgi:hypothetical protein
MRFIALILSRIKSSAVEGIGQSRCRLSFMAMLECTCLLNSFILSWKN